jgi:hypothetical protein
MRRPSNIRLRSEPIFAASRFDAIAGYAFNALTFQTFGGAPTPVGFDPNSIVRATAKNTGGIELLARYQWQKFKFYLGNIYAVSASPCRRREPPDSCSGIPSTRYAVRSDLELASGAANLLFSDAARHRASVI